MWITIIALVAVVLLILGVFSLEYIDMTFTNSDQVKRVFIITCIIGFSMTTFFAFFLSTKITQPLLEMKRAADRISQGDYETRLEVRSSDEIGELSQTFNLMAEELDETIRDLNREKEHLTSILRSMADAVITFDVEGRVLLANPQGEKIITEWGRLMAWPPESPDTLRVIDPPAGQAGGGLAAGSVLPEPIYDLFTTVRETETDVTTKLHVQNEVWSVIMAPLYESGTVRGAVAVLRDVTEEHRLDKLRKDFLANVSHELRTPLSMVQGYSEALIDEIAASPDERRELAQIIHDESLRMGRLVQDLLDLAKLEAGRMEFQFREADVSALLARVYRKFSALSKERGITLHLEIEEGVEFIGHVDDDRLEQVLTNLLDNAIRHTPAGNSIYLRAKPLELVDYTHPTAVSGRAVFIEVQDEGQGISSEDLPYVFERFYKADKARTRGAATGTGLGLAIVKSIVESHRGTIKVSSAVGQGTTFSITIPLSPIG
nr:ATP-binding protein [Paenibacillus turpanensis]